jgi:hypothetical protein
MTFDSKCYDLAETFLADIGIVNRGKIEELASEIQATIERFLDHERKLASEIRDLIAGRREI